MNAAQSHFKGYLNRGQGAAKQIYFIIIIICNLCPPAIIDEDLLLRGLLIYLGEQKKQFQ